MKKRGEIMGKWEHWWKVATIGGVLLIAGLVATIVWMDYSADPGVQFVLLNILSGAYALLSIVTVYAVRKLKGLLGKIIILANCVLSFGQLYGMDYRNYHQVLFALFIVSILYLIVGLVSFFLHKRKERWYRATNLLLYILAPCFVGFSLLIQSVRLMELIETNINSVLNVITPISLGCSAIVLIASIVLIKDRQDKKEYFGKLTASFLLPMLLTFAVPMLMSEYLNYVLDTSEAVKTQCIVIEKETRHSGKGGPRYYLIVSADGEREEINTNKVIYERYDEGDFIELYEHTGALGFTYYEYQFDDIYHYKE